MNIIIIEDAQYKIKHLLDFFSEHFPSSNITTKRSYQSGLKEIVYNSYDIAILDMSLPTYEKSPEESGGRIKSFAGREILRQIEARSIEIKSIVVTQFDIFGDPPNTLSLEELKNQLKSEFESIYIDTIFFNPASTNWKTELLDLITKFNNS